MPKPHPLFYHGVTMP